MARWFNIGGPCNPTQNYMLPAMGRLPAVNDLIAEQIVNIDLDRVFKIQTGLSPKAWREGAE